MKKTAFGQLTLSQLRDTYAALVKEQFNLRFQRATGQLEKPSRVRAVRRDIARALTLMNVRKKEGAR